MENLAGRLRHSRSLRRRLVRVPLDLDYPWWVDDDAVDLEYHVARLALPEPADWRQLCWQVARFLARPIDLTRPPWELCVIEGLDGIEGLPKGAFVVVLKVHHASIDGVSGMELMAAIHDREPAPPSTGVDHEGWEAEAPSAVGLLGRALPNAVWKPWRLLGVAAGLGPALYRRALGPQLGGEVSEASPPKTRFNAEVGPHRRVGGVRFELADVKAIKNAVPGATVNDVVLAVVGGGLRGYLEPLGELPAESLIAAMPMSVRTDQEMASGGVKLAATTVPLGTHIANPLERVGFVHRAAKARKAVRDGEDARKLLEIADSIPAGMMGLAGRVVSQLELAGKMRVANTVVTNVPGPSSPLYLSGAKMLDTYGFALVGSGLGLVNVVSSYCGGVTVGFQAGATMMPDPERYEECLRRSAAELVETVRQSRSADG